MAQLLMVNPRKRRRKTGGKKRVSSSGAVKRRKVFSRRRRNPIAVKGIAQQVMTAAVMAGGGIATDMIVARLPLSPDMKGGNMAPLVRAGVAIGLGMVLDKGLKQRKIAAEATQGALAIIAHGVMTKKMGINTGLAAYETSAGEMGAYELAAYEMSGAESLAFDGIEDNSGSELDDMLAAIESDEIEFVESGY